MKGVYLPFKRKVNNGEWQTDESCPAVETQCDAHRAGPLVSLWKRRRESVGAEKAHHTLPKPSPTPKSPLHPQPDEEHADSERDVDPVPIIVPVEDVWKEMGELKDGNAARRSDCGTAPNGKEYTMDSSNEAQDAITDRARQVDLEEPLPLARA